MVQAGDGGVGAAGGQANGAAAHDQPIVPNAADVVQVNRLAPGAAPVNMFGNAAAAPAPVVGAAAVVLAAAPVAAMLAVPPVGGQPRFDVDAALLGPLPTRSNFKDYEIHPRIDEDEP